MRAVLWQIFMCFLAALVQSLFCFLVRKLFTARGFDYYRCLLLLLHLLDHDFQCRILCALHKKELWDLGVPILCLCYWKGVMGSIDDNTSAPIDASQLAQWKIKDARVMSWILGSVDP